MALVALSCLLSEGSAPVDVCDFGDVANVV